MGGQEAYIRFLGDTLSEAHFVSGVSRYENRRSATFEFHESEGPKQIDRPRWSLKFLRTNPLTIPLLLRLISLYTRRPWQPLALSILQLAYGKTMQTNLPKDVDVVHYIGAGWDAISHVALRAAREKKAVFAVTPFVHPGDWAESPLDIRFYNQADLVFVCSEYERDFLIKKGVQPSLLRITGLAPASQFQGDGRRFREKHRLGDRPLILFIARKQRYKGYHALRLALAQIAEKVPGVCLVAVGSDREPPYPEVVPGGLLDLGSLSLADADEQEKADALAAADLFCMPSEAEAFGIVYVEAWANHCPVIAGGAPAVRELVVNGVNGFRVTDQDPQQIAHYAIQILTNRGLRERLGEAGYRLVQERYNWETIAAEHVEAYRQAAKAASPPV